MKIPFKLRIIQSAVLALISHQAAAQAYQDPGKAGDPASWRTPEFNADWGVGAMKSEYAYARGFTGKGVPVGVVDSGYYLKHSEFKDRGVQALTVTGVASADSYYTDDNQLNLLKKGQPFSVPADQLEYIHGTHVLGSIGAARNGAGMQGVAFDSSLIVANTNGTDGLPYDQHLDYNYFKAAYDAVSNAGARVVNSSWGQNPLNAGDLATLQNAYKNDYQGKLTFLDAAADQAKKGVDMVWTAGNSGFANPSLRASLPYFRPELAGHWLAVAWLNQADPSKNGLNGNVSISSSSNKCGIAKYWCISAPGGTIYSTTFKDADGNETFPDPATVQEAYKNLSGTSMAAPHASGALALVMQRYAYLGNAETMQILLTTARHLNVNPKVADADQNSPNAVYGWGIPDLDKAMNGPAQFGIQMSGDAFLDGQARLINPIFNATLPADVSDTWSNNISGPGGLMKDGAGSLTLAGKNTYAGMTAIAAGTLAVNGSVTSPTVILPAGTLAGSGIVGDVRNGGALSPGALQGPLAGGVLTVRGAYHGDGGVLKLNTVLATDNAASDKLVIDGSSGAASATGNTKVIVKNAGGAGAATSSDGILLVQALGSATTDAGAFSLLGGVRAGAYDYRLFRGGLNPTLAASSQNWFLRSSYVIDPPATTTPPATPAAPPTPPAVPLPSDSNNIVATPQTLHIVGPELSVYGSAAPTAAQLGMATIGTLQDRMGGQDGAGAAAGSESGERAWGRAIGQQFRAQYASLVNPSTSGTVAGAQVGSDLYRGSNQWLGGRDRAGVYFAADHANTSVKGLVTNAEATGNTVQDTGNVSLDGWSGGAYLTHFGESGWYLDLLAQATWYSGRAATQRTAIGLHGYGAAASAEFAYPIALSANWRIEPRAQLVYQHVHLKSAEDAFSTVAPGNLSNTLGSVGVRTLYTIDSGKWQLQPYLFANLWSMLGGVQSNTVYGGVDTVGTDSGARWAQVGGGITAKASDVVSLYARLSGLVGIGGNTRRGTEASVGARFFW